MLALLRDRKNVLLSGAPGTGKTRLLREVLDAFVAPTGPAHVPGAPIPIPPGGGGGAPAWLPSPSRPLRRAFPTVFDQNTRTRDVLRGVGPALGAAHRGVFRVYDGVLYRANEVAATADGTALVVIDEINRGPAVAAFGASIVALDADKRLDVTGQPTPTTAYFEVINDLGDAMSYALSDHLYLLAAMNTADVSVEPLDVAFQRRFAPYVLEPMLPILRDYLGLPAQPAAWTPASPAVTAEDVYEAFAAAWSAANNAIRLIRGPDFQLGHGGVMQTGLALPPLTAGSADALDAIGPLWDLLAAHMREVFFGDTLALAEGFAAGRPGSPYQLQQQAFAGRSVASVTGPPHPRGTALYELMAAISTTAP